MIFIKKKFNIYTEGPSNLLVSISKRSFRNKYICVLATHGFSYALINKKFNEALCNSLANVPDGMPIALYSSFKAKYNVKRIYGPDLMVNILHNFNSRKNKKIFFIGGNKIIKRIILKKLKNEFTNLSIVGFDCRFVKNDIIEMDLVNKINLLKPDVVFVGIGCPRQEIWMNMNAPYINSLLIGVGAAFDFFAGKKKQAPKYIQKLYLEWLYRLIQEPRRLFFRYLIYNSIFIIYCLYELATYFFNIIKINKNK